MTPLTPEDIARLQKCLDSHRRKANKLGVPADDVRVDDLLAKSLRDPDGNHLCKTCGCVLCFNPDAVREDNKAHIGHMHHLSGKARPSPLEPITHPGHVLSNIDLQCKLCNETDNHQTVAPCNAKARKMTPVKGRPNSGSIRSRGKLPTKADKARWLASKGG